jgi:hypothetical protein
MRKKFAPQNTTRDFQFPDALLADPSPTVAYNTIPKINNVSATEITVVAATQAGVYHAQPDGQAVGPDFACRDAEVWMSDCACLQKYAVEVQLSDGGKTAAAVEALKKKEKTYDVRVANALGGRKKGTLAVNHAKGQAVLKAGKETAVLVLAETKFVHAGCGFCVIAADRCFNVECDEKQFMELATYFSM